MSSGTKLNSKKEKTAYFDTDNFCLDETTNLSQP